MVHWLTREGRVEILPEPNGDVELVTYVPDLDMSKHFRVRQEMVGRMTADDLRRWGIRQVCEEFSTYLTSDIMTAQRLKVPLGSSLSPHLTMLRRSEELTAQAVAFHLDLPVLDDIPVAELLKLRKEEQECFLRFQTRLRLAIAEREKTSGAARPEQIAKQIEQDIIQPELDNIRERLAASERVLVRKSGVGLFLGALSTTCGLLVGVGPVGAAAAGVATVAPAVYAAAGKYIEEQRDISLEGMYFLWKATGHAPEH
jgi:hypothetical protein